METLDDDGCVEVDKALSVWSQGDCTVGSQWFTFQVAPTAPLTPEALVAAEEASALEAWEKRIQPTDRFIHVQASVTTLDELTARDYVESDRLDLDHL